MISQLVESRTSLAEEVYQEQLPFPLRVARITSVASWPTLPTEGVEQMKVDLIGN